MYPMRSAGAGASVVWVELAGLTEPAYVVGAIAGAIGVSTGGADPLRALIKALTPFEMLIALDNAEHLVDEVASVAQALVEGAPGVRVLVTSQAPLKVAAERVYRLGALSVPEAACAVERSARPWRGRAVRRTCARARPALRARRRRTPRP